MRLLYYSSSTSAAGGSVCPRFPPLACNQVRMAERSKALRSGRSPLLWAWVRIPLLTTIFFEYKKITHFYCTLFIFLKGNVKKLRKKNATESNTWLSHIPHVYFVILDMLFSQPLAFLSLSHIPRIPISFLLV